MNRFREISTVSPAEMQSSINEIVENLRNMALLMERDINEEKKDSIKVAKKNTKKNEYRFLEADATPDFKD
jgi:hypothetical protein